MQGDFARAAAMSAEGVALYRRIGERDALLQPQFNLGVAALLGDRDGDALAIFREGLELALALGYVEGLVYFLEGHAAVRSARGEGHHAAVLAGAAGAAAERVGSRSSRSSARCTSARSTPRPARSEPPRSPRRATRDAGSSPRTRRATRCAWRSPATGWRRRTSTAHIEGGAGCRAGSRGCRAGSRRGVPAAVRCDFASVCDANSQRIGSRGPMPGRTRLPKSGS